MAGKYEAKKKKRGNGGLVFLLILLILILLAAAAFIAWKLLPQVLGKAGSAEAPSAAVFETSAETETEPETTVETEPPTTAPPEPEHVVTTATIGAMGDLLMHKPIIDSVYQGYGSYNFDEIFQYISEDVSACDYASANLETTLYGSGKAYSGYPYFNCPDTIVTDAKEAGFDLLQTANNHCNDTGLDGYLRTIEVCEEAGIDHIGTMASADDPKYIIRDINGIKIGLICYTYETTDGTGSIPSLNGLPFYGGSYDLINCFSPDNPEPFYTQIAGYFDEMRGEGAEAIVLFIHWGTEYLTYAKDTQIAMAQRLCDLGVDVIVGAHPHVIEPIELLTSTDGTHQTLCYYSLGNAVSNQRLGNISYVSTAHTEDGLLAEFTFEKYSDGTVYLASADAVPTWVNRYWSVNRNIYNILPLHIEQEDSWQTAFGVDANTALSMHNSYDRTQEIVGEGLSGAQEALENAKADREAYYYDLAYFPEKYATEPTEETVEETVQEAADETAEETEELVPAA